MPACGGVVPGSDIRGGILADESKRREGQGRQAGGAERQAGDRGGGRAGRQGGAGDRGGAGRTERRAGDRGGSRGRQGGREAGRAGRSGLAGRGWQVGRGIHAFESRWGSWGPWGDVRMRYPQSPPLLFTSPPPPLPPAHPPPLLFTFLPSQAPPPPSLSPHACPSCPPPLPPPTPAHPVGLGKTVELLACILGNRYKPATADQQGRGQQGPGHEQEQGGMEVDDVPGPPDSRGSRGVARGARGGTAERPTATLARQQQVRCVCVCGSRLEWEKNASIE